MKERRAGWRIGSARQRMRTSDLEMVSTSATYLGWIRTEYPLLRQLWCRFLTRTSVGSSPGAGDNKCSFSKYRTARRGASSVALSMTLRKEKTRRCRTGQWCSSQGSTRPPPNGTEAENPTHRGGMGENRIAISVAEATHLDFRDADRLNEAKVGTFLLHQLQAIKGQSPLEPGMSLHPVYFGCGKPEPETVSAVKNHL